jgi:hypothetical protein
MLGFLIFSTMVLCLSATPIYDHNKSNVTPLTNFNFNDQVNKIRQTTNYVNIIHFDKHGVNPHSNLQMISH